MLNIIRNATKKAMQSSGNDSQCEMTMFYKHIELGNRIAQTLYSF